MRKKNTQENEDEWWARLDKRIERVRARHELARLGIGTIFLVYGSFRVKSYQHKTFYPKNRLKLGTGIVHGKILFCTNFEAHIL